MSAGMRQTMRNDKNNNNNNETNNNNVNGNAPPETSGSAWTTLALPAVLGRRNLVESWWKMCPDPTCQARKRCQPSSNNVQQQQSSSLSSSLSKRINDDEKQNAASKQPLIVCGDCKPLMENRQVLTLSKAMLHVSLDGTITVTAKHRQLVRIVPETISNPEPGPSADNKNNSSKNKYPTWDTPSSKPLGMLLVGAPITKNGGGGDSPRPRLREGVWMKFRLKLRTDDDNDDHADISGEDDDDDAAPIDGTTTVPTQKKKAREETNQTALGTWVKASSTKPFSSARKRRRHQKFSAFDNEDDSGGDESIVTPPLQRLVTLVHQDERNNNNNNSDPQDKENDDDDEFLRRGTAFSYRRPTSAAGDHAIGGAGDSSKNKATLSPTRRKLLFGGGSLADRQDSHNDATTTRARTKIRSEKTTNNINNLTDWASMLTPHSLTPKNKRFITPEIQQRKENETRTIPVVNESQHKRRRLAELQEAEKSEASSRTPVLPPPTPALEAASSRDDGLSSNPSSGPISQTKTPTPPVTTTAATTTTTMAGPTLKTTNHNHNAGATAVAVAGGGILSMPGDDHSEEALEEMSLAQNLCEVCTQKDAGRTSPLGAITHLDDHVNNNKHDTDNNNNNKAVQDLTLSDWRRLLSSSREGSFRRALAGLVVAKNSRTNNHHEPVTNLWLPPLLDSKTRIDTIS